MVRFIIGLPFAGAITIALFLLMRYLVLPGDEPIEEVVSGPKIDITRPERDENTQARDRNKPARPKKQSQPPPPPPMQMDKNVKPMSNTMSMSMPDFDSDLNLSALGAPSDRTATPLVRIPPQYPQRAASRGTEGWVLVEFTITPAGTVTDAVVIDADPASIFDRSALRAIAKWKYRPKIVDQKPVAQYGMQQLISYELEQ